ncbi:MAG: hypothetical protein FJ297_01155 [Planctomycetes bacterium]|nr:hypothetical protein [Planctomycetota bacterium]
MFGLLFGRHTVFLLLLGAATIGPYLWNLPGWRERLAKAWHELAGRAEAVADVSQLEPWTAATPSAQASASADPNATAPSLVSLADPGAPRDGNTASDRPTPSDRLVGPQVVDFAEVFRFDITQRWVLDRWSRVTTILSEFDLEGLRVPFVSGTRVDDVAGSLTYYFDQRHQLQRITFEGRCGDDRRFARFVQGAFGLELEPSHYAGLLVTKWNGVPKSVLWVRHAAVVQSRDPHARLEITLELNRPDGAYRLSQPLDDALDLGRKARRWGG